MLIVTYAGIVVNADHIAYLICKPHAGEPGAPELTSGNGSRFKLLLCLANGAAIVAAVNLRREEARSLRQTIAQRWILGCGLIEVNSFLPNQTAPIRQAKDNRLHIGKKRR